MREEVNDLAAAPFHTSVEKKWEVGRMKVEVSKRNGTNGDNRFEPAYAQIQRPCRPVAQWHGVAEEGVPGLGGWPSFLTRRSVKGVRS